MKLIFTPLTLLLFFTIFITESTYSQAMPLPDTTRPWPAPNVGFDVIIKKNGDIVYGLVKEVGPIWISYKRTDIPDGPVYVISRNEVYAISYRNQVKDYLAPVIPVIDTALIHGMLPPLTRNSFRRNAHALIGLGFFRSYTGVSDAGSYTSSGTFPVVSLAYEFPFRDAIRLGVQVAVGPHKFSRTDYSSYDSTVTSETLKETIFTLHVYGKYNFSYRTAFFQPYILLGLGIRNSYIKSEQNINFLDNTSNSLLINSGSNSLGIGILARIGAEYSINSRLRIFADAGVGASVLTIGISTNVD